MELFDGHCDTLTRCLREGTRLGRNPGNVDLERGRGLGPWAQFFALFPEPDVIPGGGASPETVFEVGCRFFEEELAANGDILTQCRTGTEVRAALDAGKCAAVLSVEGAELLGCSLEGLEEGWKRGVRAVNLTWNHANALSGSVAEEPDRGLSPQGRAFVKRMGELGMLVDVSHLSEPGFWDVAELVKGPFVATHSNARAVCPHPRNLSDEMFSALVRSGGVAGLNLFRLFVGEPATVDRAVAHIEHFLSLGGERSICIGGDLDGCGDRLPDGISGVQDLGRLYERLLRRNYPEALVRAVFFDNLMRVVNEVCTM